MTLAVDIELGRPELLGTCTAYCCLCIHFGDYKIPLQLSHGQQMNYIITRSGHEHKLNCHFSDVNRELSQGTDAVLKVLFFFCIKLHIL